MNFIYILKKNQVLTNDILLSINLRFPVYQPTQTWYVNEKSVIKLISTPFTPFTAYACKICVCICIIVYNLIIIHIVRYDYQLGYVYLYTISHTPVPSVECTNEFDIRIEKLVCPCYRSFKHHSHFLTADHEWHQYHSQTFNTKTHTKPTHLWSQNKLLNTRMNVSANYKYTFQILSIEWNRLDVIKFHFSWYPDVDDNLPPNTSAAVTYVCPELNMLSRIL